jgi:lysophospholipase L1-like esterase
MRGRYTPTESICEVLRILLPIQRNIIQSNNFNECVTEIPENECNFKKFFYLMIILEIFTLSISGLVFIKMGGLVILGNILNSKSENSVLSMPNYLERTSLFDRLPAEPDSIVFLGDSLTEQCNWNELLRNEKIINRGIGSDTTFGVLNRLKQITDKKPKSIFIMIGIVDISEYVDLTESISNYEKMLLTIKKDTPDTTIYIQSVLPVNESLRKAKNSDIVAFNAKLKVLSQKYDIRYVDLYQLFSTNNSLLANVSEDGVHLNGNGYAIWKEAINGYI